MGSANEKVQSRSVVKVTLEVSPTDVWGSDCAMDQVFRQGRAAAIGMLRTLCEQSHGAIRIIGEPQVSAVLVEVRRD